MRAQDSHLRELARKRVLRLCDWCFKSNRRCYDSVRTFTVKTWKAYRQKQWRHH